jgi:hypothetical protein
MTNTSPPAQTKPSEQPAHAEHGCCGGRDQPDTVAVAVGVDTHETVTPRDDAPASSCCGGTSHTQH